MSFPYSAREWRYSQLGKSCPMTIGIKEENAMMQLCEEILILEKDDLICKDGLQKDTT